MNDDEKHLATARAVDGVLPNVAAVLRKSVGERYTAESLEDIAQHFERLAKAARHEANDLREQWAVCSSHREHGHAEGLEHAARILRATKLKGL